MKPSRDCQRWIAIADQQALEETPSAGDLAFYERHLAGCEACRDEAEGFQAIRRIIDNELAPVQRPRARRRRFTPLVVAAAGLAAAAAVLFIVRRPVEAPPATIVAEERGSCLELEDATRVCLSAGSRLRPLVGASGFELLAGRVAVALEPQPEGSNFVIRNGGYDVAALGTVFSVDAGDVSTVRLLSGKVRVTDRQSGEQWLLPAEHRFDGAVRPLVSGDREVVEGLVGHVEHRPELARMQPAPPPPEPEPQPDVTPKSRRHHPRKQTLAKEPEPTPMAKELAAPDTPDVTERLRRIRQLRASGHYAEAASGYEELIAAHPGSAEAQAALVSLGELRLGPLRDPSGARRAFEIYLSGPSGTLEESARYGLIRALRQSSKEQDERRAIEAFLEKFPKSIHAASLRSRLSQIE